MPIETLIGAVNGLREEALAFQEKIITLLRHDDFQNDVAEGQDFGEAIANIKLAYRHAEDARMRLGKIKLAYRRAEDARMRLGKIIQAMDGGTSIYDKKRSEGTQDMPTEGDE